MNVTSESTGLDDQYRARRLPPDLLHRTNVLLDERDSLLIEVARLQPQASDAKAKAKKARADYARADRTARLHATIDAMIELHRLQLVGWTGTATARAKWLQKLIKTQADDAIRAELQRMQPWIDGDASRTGWMMKLLKAETGPVPGWRYVYDYLETLQL